MSDVELVIKIPEEIYKASQILDVKYEDTVQIPLEVIKNSVSLPQGHGRLCDLDELVKNIVKEYGVNSVHELPQDIKTFYDKFISSAPTILDATVDYKLKNYAFFRKGKEINGSN